MSNLIKKDDILSTAIDNLWTNEFYNENERHEMNDILSTAIDSLKKEFYNEPDNDCRTQILLAIIKSTSKMDENNKRLNALLIHKKNNE